MGWFKLFLFYLFVKTCLPCLTVLSWSFISLPFCCTLQISVEINKQKKTLIVDYINKNIFVLSLTFNLFCYELYKPSVFRSQADPRHAMPLCCTGRASVPSAWSFRVVSKCSLNKFGIALSVPCCL